MRVQDDGVGGPPISAHARMEEPAALEGSVRTNWRRTNSKRIEPLREWRFKFEIALGHVKIGEATFGATHTWSRPGVGAKVARLVDVTGPETLSSTIMIRFIPAQVVNNELADRPEPQ